MLWLVLLLITILISLNTIVEGFTERMLPFHSPFHTDFHRHHEPVVTIDNNRSTDRLRAVTADIKQKPVLNDADLKLVPEFQIVKDNKDEYEYGFVATLHQPVLLLLARDESGLLDFNDIQHYSCRVKIGIPHQNSPERRVISDILNYYPIGVRDNVDIIPLHKWTTEKITEPIHGLYLGHDYHIYAQLVYPDKGNAMIRKLTEEAPSHLMSAVRINTGNYFVTHAERPFYKKNQYYDKALYDLQRSIRYFPQLSRIGNQQHSLYLPTIKCRFILLAKLTVSDRTIKKIMKRLFQLYTRRRVKDMTMTDIVRNITHLPMHSAAREIYSHLELVGNMKSGIYERKHG